MKKILVTTLLILTGITHFFAQVKVEGTITDDTGYALPGVSISIKGTTQGTITDINGIFSLEVPDSSSVLQLSFVGFEAVEVTAADAIKIFGGSYSKKEKKKGKKAKKKETKSVKNIDIENDTDVITNNDTIVQQTEEKPQIDHKKDLKQYLNGLEEGKSCSPFMYAYGTDPKETVHLPLKETRVEVNIAGIIADVVVKQIYINNSNDVIEAVYVFPGSTQAAVYDMNMQIGKRILKAKIKEKQEARQIYEQAKAEGKTASLLEQHRPNVFQMDVANILPGDTIVVDFRYTETVAALNGEYKFLFPRIVGPRYSTTNESWVHQQKMQENADIDFDIKINILSPIPIKEITTDSLKINFTQEDRRSAEITLDDSEKKLRKSDIVVKYRLRGDKVESGILTYEHEDENFFLVMMEPPKKVKKEDVPPREYIIIMDVSGSMNGYPIQTSKTLLINLAKSFEPTDVFNVVQFAAGSQAFREKSVPATEANLSEAIKFIDQPQGSGGTELLAGLKTAFDLRVDSGYSTTFIISTDGYVTAEKGAFNFIRENLNKANVFCFGIGGGVNHYIIEGIAYAGMGDKFVVTNHLEAEKIADGMIEQIKHPVLTDIKTEFSGVEIYDVEPQNIPDVFSNRPIVLYGKYKGKAEGKIKIKGKSGRRTIQENFKLKKSDKNNALRYLWARNRIKYLSDYAFYFEDNYSEQKNVTDERKQKIINLGLKYNLLTDYTSFVATDTMVRIPTSSQTNNYNQQQNQPIQIRGASSNVGYYNKTYSTPKVSGTSISLSTSSCGLDECVVVGYGTQTRTEITGSISSVDAEDLLAVNNIPGSILRSKVTGLNILRGDNIYESGTHANLCGLTSVLRNTYPVIWFDGIELQKSIFADNYLINSNFNNNKLPLDPDFLESIQVIKSGYAISPDENADMGIFTITPKSPKYGKKLYFNSSYSFDKVGKLPDGLSENQKAVFKNGFTLRNSVYASRETEQISVGLMASNTRQKSFIPGNDLTVNNIGFKGEFRLLQRLNLKTGVYWLNQDEEALPRHSANTGLLYSLLNEGAEQAKLLIDNSKSSFTQNILLPSLSLDYEILDGLQLKYRVFVDLRKSERTEQFLSGYSGYNNGSSFYMMNQMQNISHRPELSFYKSFNYDHRLRVNISMTFNQTEETHILSDINGNIGNPSDAEYQENYNKNVINARLNYSFKDTWLFSSSYGRINNNLFSDIFSSTNQYSVATGCNYSSLEIFNNWDWLSSGKLSFGYDRNETTPPVFLSPAMVFAGSLSATDPLYATSLFKASYTRDINPEIKEKYSLNHTLGLFNERLNLTVELYKSKTKNMFVPTDIDNYLIGNNGELVSKGINAELGFYQNNYKWSFSQQLLLTVNRSTVENLENNQEIILAGIEGIRSYAINNQPFGLIVTETGETGNPNPDWLLAYNGNIGWKGFNLGFTTEWKQGGKLWNAHSNQIEDASWFKIRQLQLGYSIPSSIIRRLRMNSSMVYVFANNPLTATKYSGVSPDTHFFGNVSSTGIDYYNMPDIRSFGGGLKIEF